MLTATDSHVVGTAIAADSPAVGTIVAADSPAAIRPCTLKILMFPWLAHGHIFPYLELAKRLLSRKNFHIHLCTIIVNFPSIQDFILKNSLQHSIDLVELHLQPSPDLPPHHQTTKNLPSNLNIPAFHFLPLGTATTSYVYHHYYSTEQTFPFPELHLADHAKESMDSFTEFLKDNIFFEDRNPFINFELSSGVVLMKTCRALEGKYIDYLSGAFRKKLRTVGPLAATVISGSSEILRWLDGKGPRSTMYVSFGSECFPSKEEMAEIARGLESCHASFVWVVRFPAEGSIPLEEALPEGFLGRVGERGMVVVGWAPQADVLAHRSTGGFVSHCGWSSLMESVYYGVPVIGMPMKLNMFIDVKMMVDAGVCVEVERKGNGEVYKGEEIAKAINEVIVEKTGEQMRGRALELSEKMRVKKRWRWMQRLVNKAPTTNHSLHPSPPPLPPSSSRSTQASFASSVHSDTINSSPMPEKEMVELHDDESLEMRAKGVVTNSSSAIVAFQERQLSTSMEIEKTV
ncbi:flavonoid glycosyltransferase UGT94C2 [Striga asiatica]|uniref:Flavonoid glycosyltransferase UGT94C2 n=1 Tax=Striga asiatica TaxID=4170 RepID=A0A5A7RGM4_STRAF|nr:flavonoid glycosyltransferase UGT94C2 [Striga asiatica]